MDVLFIVLGLLLLVKGGDYLVDGAVAIAQRVHLSHAVIGLTVVGFGTSMPELLVSVQSALAGNSGIAIGNVVGSNISNIALILGLTALIHPIPATRTTLHVDMPFMLLASLLFVLVAMSGTIGRWEGLTGFLLLVVFVAYQIRKSRQNEADATDETVEAMPLYKAIPMVMASFVAMVYGADRLVSGASHIATALGVSDRVIGLTIVAVGTSLPECFASVIAARKGETDMAIGNIIGSVTFNILSVVGLSAAIAPIQQSNIGFASDYAIMTLLGLLLWFFLRTNHLLERWEGALLTSSYVAYLIVLICHPV